MARVPVARRSMRYLSVLSLSALLVLSACDSSSNQARLSGAGPADTVEFQLASLAGGTLGPEDFRGRVVLFDFWATWCRPCHLQAEILASLYPEFEKLGVAFVAVSLGEPESTVRKFTERRPFPYPVLVDPADALTHRLGIYVLPTVMILDADGRIVYLREGVSTAGRLREALEESLEVARVAAS